MEFDQVICIVYGVMILIFYVVVGVLLHTRQYRKSIYKRSYILLQFSHWGNFGELIFFYLMLFSLLYVQENPIMTTNQLYQSMTLFFHMIMYIPYILRSYRLQTVFDVRSTEIIDETQEINKSISHRQLIRRFMIIMIPVVVISLCILLIPQITYFTPGSYNTGQKAEVTRYIFVAQCFIEELILVIAAYHQRNVEKEYDMGFEMSAICVIWFAGSLSSILLGQSWLISVSLRNIFAMIFTSLIPVIQSFQVQDLNEEMTIDLINNFEFVLQNQKCFNLFEEFIKLYDSTNGRSNIGQQYLKFWMECQLLYLEPKPGQEQHIFDTYLKDNILQLPFHILFRFQGNDFDENAYMEAQGYVEDILENVYYVKFQNSPLFTKLLKYSKKKQRVTNRMALTSLNGGTSFADDHLRRICNR